MQRKVVVDVKTIDDEHWSKKCSLLNDWYPAHCTLNPCHYLKLEEDKIGYLRTAECKKGEVK